MSEPYEILPGLTLEKLHDGKILVWSASASTRAISAAWYEHTKKQLEDWPENQPYLALLNMARVILTPFARDQAKELTEIRADISGRVAVVVSPSPTGHLIRLFVNRSLPKTRERRVFFSFDEALTWLEEAL